MKTAIFYDLENIALVIKNGELDQAINALRQKIEASELVTDIVLQKAYISKNHPNLAQIEPVLKKHKIELVAVEPISGVGKKKANLVDFKMSVDVVATIAANRGIKTVAMASGDNDFGFLCQHIKEMGKKLLLISRYATTGEAMLKLCDDWVNLSEEILTPKCMLKFIRKRISTDYSQADFLEALGDFLRALEDDLVIRRYLSSFGLPLPMFIAVLHERIAQFPKYDKLGFANISGLMEIVLSGTSFECKGNIVKYSESKPPLLINRLIDSILFLPPGYTREKLFEYYDVIAKIDQVDEFLEYVNFMKHSGMLNGNTLCRKRTFRATIREHLRNMMKKAGIALDEAALMALNKKL
ncbi:MAG: NYN domain-containing protein [Clostridiales bacterium]|nr:NYN domain-containing protein [Clostridiales bacterium]